MDYPSDKFNKHILFRLNHADNIKKLSPCPRAQVGAVIFDPDSYAIISDGFNGPPRKGGDLCGGDVCNRDTGKVPSGTRCEIGCHHAEFNAICNAARLGHPTKGKHIAISCAPCLMCAKMIHHAGIERVYFLNKMGYSLEGVKYLTKYLDVDQIE